MHTYITVNMLYTHTVYTTHCLLLLMTHMKTRIHTHKCVLRSHLVPLLNCYNPIRGQVWTEETQKRQSRWLNRPRVKGQVHKEVKRRNQCHPLVLWSTEVTVCVCVCVRKRQCNKHKC